MKQVLTMASAAGQASRPRLRGLESLRALACVLVVLLHAGVPYMTAPMSHLAWPARSPHPSSAVDGLVWCLEGFLMPLFFLLGGFFSQGLLNSRGEQRFLNERTRRLLPTQMVAGFAILPFCLVIWCVGWVADGLYVPQDWMNTGIPPELEVDLYGCAHLWFLQNLYLYCLGLYGIDKLLKRWQKAGWDPGASRIVKFLDRGLTSLWKPLLPAIPCALILYWDPRIVLGFYQQFFPVLTKLIYYAPYFLTGALMTRYGSSLANYTRYGWFYLAGASLLFIAILPEIHQHLQSPFSGLRLATLTGMLVLFAWLSVFGLLAVFLRFDRGNAVTEYLAEASFWVYLIHLPFVVMTHIALAPLKLPTDVKFAITGITGLTLSLLTNKAFVRNKWLGWFLDGCRQRSVPVVAPNPAPPRVDVSLPLPIPRPQPVSASHVAVANAHSIG